MAENIYSNIQANKYRTILIVILFPLALAGLITGALYLYGAFAQSSQAQASYYNMLNQTLPYILSLVFGFGLLWLLISYFAGAKMILSSAGAKEIKKADNPEVYRLVENLAITAGLPCPKIFIIEDESLNAFATGRDPNRASITLTTGIINILNRQELEGVIAHEMSHIGNRDIRLMLLMVAGIGFCTFIGQLLIRGAFYGRNKNGGLIALVGLTFLLFGLLVAPLIRLAVSRRREYQADTTAALLTRNPLGLASALQKISKDARVEVLDSQASVSAMCIANPLKKVNSLFGALSGITATHPPIKDRISKLEAMGK